MFLKVNCCKCQGELASSKQVSGIADATVPVVPQVTSSKGAVASLLAVVSRFASELQLSKLHSKPDVSMKSAMQQPDSITDAACSPSVSALTVNAPAEKTATSLGNSPSSSASSRNAALAAATALHNLLLDKGAQQLVCDLQGIATISKLLVPSDWLLAARAAGKCSMHLLGTLHCKPAVADTMSWVAPGILQDLCQC